jgi:ATP-dependent DNA helicase RecQ
MLRRQPRDGRRQVRKTAREMPASAADVPLFEALREWRAARAKEQGVPAYVILHDRTLRELAAARPPTVDDLLRVSGIGAAKAARYGAKLLEVINRTA